MLCAVFVRPRRPLGDTRIVKTNVVNFMPLMHMAQHLQRANLSAARSGMKEIGLNPKQFHQELMRNRKGVDVLPHTLTGDKQLAPHLQVDETP